MVEYTVDAWTVFSNKAALGAIWAAPSTITAFLDAHGLGCREQRQRSG